ncbi:MAG TPA: TRAP transporter TatT component family protein [Pyrinomonadaceae bacterium]|jgi:hypothetical protein
MNITPEDVTTRADALYGAREQAEGVRASVELLRAGGEPQGYEAAWRLGRALFFLGQEACDEEEARSSHADAVRASLRAARLEPGRVEGHFWLGVNYALLARLERRRLKALASALRARRSLGRAVRLDPAYHGAGPLRVLARLQSRLPFVLGGGRGRARVNYERAISLAPANTVTRLYFAELLLETGDDTRARLELEALLNLPFDSGWAFEIRRDRRIARELLNGLAGKS